MTRKFEDSPANRELVPLLLGLVGPSSSGKTLSAIRLAAGMQRVINSEIFYIDTESLRAKHYAPLKGEKANPPRTYDFRHVDMKAPFGPLDYLDAIEHCVSKGAKILIIDSMTNEHSGVGGVMDQAEDFLDSRCGDDWKKREKMQMLAYVKPKQQRKRLNARIVQLGVNAILCYRADEKIKPVKGGEPLKLGWQPETTSKLHYEMAQRFLLTPGCDGKPQFFPQEDAEKLLVKNPMQFRDWFKDGVQLNEDIGEKFAMWAAGGISPADLATKYTVCQSQTEFDALEAERAAAWQKLNAATQKSLKAASDAAKTRLATHRREDLGPSISQEVIDDPALDPAKGGAS